MSAVPRKGFRAQFLFQPGGVAQAHQEEGEVMFPIFEHRTEQGSAKFELQDESDGTQRLFSARCLGRVEPEFGEQLTSAWQVGLAR